MSKKLIIAEKPNLAIKIAEAVQNMNRSNGYFENKDYIITFAFGHLFELKSIEQYLNCENAKWSLEQLPFFPEKFEYTLRDDNSVRKQYKIIKSLYKRPDVKSIINAGDPDREGSVIVLNILRELEKETGIHKPVERIWLTATTPELIRETLGNLKPEEFYGNLYEEGLTRTYIDWLWGINFTRFVTLKAGKFYPVGRVLIPVVKFIYDRDKTIEKFQQEIYYEIQVGIEKDGMKVKSKIKGLQFSYSQKKQGESLCKDISEKLEKSEFEAVVNQVEVKKVKKTPPKLFSLDKLQNKMSVDFQYSSAETLAIAQNLYEKGYITYPRTNTEYLATAEKESINEILQKLSKEEGVSLVLRENTNIFNDSKIEGHTALIITGNRPENLSEREKNVYQTIKNRFISNFLDEESILQETKVEIGISESSCFHKPADNSKIFYLPVELTGTEILQKGFLKYEPIVYERILPYFTRGEKLENLHMELVEKSVRPPAHVSESELNRFLKNPFKKAEIEDSLENSDADDYKAMLKGCELGTVATRAGIIENAQRYEYIRKEQNVFHITEKGIALIHMLEQLEINLDKTKTVEIGIDLKKVYRKEITLDEVVKKNKKDIAEIIKRGKSTGSTTEKKVGSCPICGGSVLSGKKKYFCSNHKEKSCNFVIWKVIAQKELTEKQAKKLLKRGKTSVIKGFVKKAGGTFDAALFLDKSGKVKFDFSKKRKFKIF